MDNFSISASHPYTRGHAHLLNTVTNFRCSRWSLAVVSVNENDVKSDSVSIGWVLRDKTHIE